MTCPHCGNDDATLIEELRPSILYLCLVCAKQWTNSKQS